jgi:NAD(P)-dependent dehydrogenase (short-subunit alcohol dehydrogenase family)
VNISSGGTHPWPSWADCLPWNKGDKFTKGLAHELATRTVTVKTVSPGFTDTAMLWDSFRETSRTNDAKRGEQLSAK